jgi:hypothetical protein
MKKGFSEQVAQLLLLFTTFSDNHFRHSKLTEEEAGRQPKF